MNVTSLTKTEIAAVICVYLMGFFTAKLLAANHGALASKIIQDLNDKQARV